MRWLIADEPPLMLCRAEEGIAVAFMRVKEVGEVGQVAKLVCGACLWRWDGDRAGDGKFQG